MDYREQDGTQDYWDGGYMNALEGSDGNHWHTDLVGEMDWSGQTTQVLFEQVYVAEDGGVGHDELPVMRITGHQDDYYNGDYFLA